MESGGSPLRHGRTRLVPNYPTGRVQRLIVRFVTVSPGPFRPQLDAAVAEVSIQVNRDTVLQARAALLAEADWLDFELQRQSRDLEAGVGLCGGDPVSPEAAAGFNERIFDLVEYCRCYNRDLRAAARALDVTARSYGYTEDEIAASFRGGW